MYPKINKEASAVRRSASEGSIYTFAKMYLSAHLKFEPSEAHKEIYAELQKASNNRGVKLAVAAPRYFGKSTLITLIYILYSICYGKEKFIIIISNTASQATHTLDNIKLEFLKKNIFFFCSFSGFVICPQVSEVSFFISKVSSCFFFDFM